MNSVRQMGAMIRLMSTTAAAKKVSAKDLQPMIYPYTYTGKLIQFPWTYHFKNSWLHRYILYSMIVCYPLFVFIHFKGKNCPRTHLRFKFCTIVANTFVLCNFLVNSPEAKIAWETKKRLDFEKEHKHEWDI